MAKTIIGTPDRGDDPARRPNISDAIRMAAIQDPKLNTSMGKYDHTGKMEPVMNPGKLGEEVRLIADLERSRGEYQALHDEKDN